MRMLVWLLLAIAAVPSPCRASDSIFSFGVLGDGSAVTVVSDGSRYYLNLGSGIGMARLPLKDLDSVADIKPNPRILVSPDSRYVAVEYQADEITGMVSVFEVEGPRELRSFAATSAAWAQEAGVLMVVPPYDFDAGPAEDGLLRIDVNSGAEEKIGVGHYFTGQIRVNGAWVAARTFRSVDGIDQHCLVVLGASDKDAVEIGCE